MAEKVKRNYDAEKYEQTLIPKNTLVFCGISEIETSVDKVEKGPHRGRPQQRFRTTFRVLDGEFAGLEFRNKINNQTERMPGGNIDPYGNSKKYAQMCAACLPDWDVDDIWFEDTTNIANMANECFVGKVMAITVGTFEFTGDAGKKIKVQTCKTIEPLSEDARLAIGDKIAEFTAMFAAANTDADEGLLDDDDDAPF